MLKMNSIMVNALEPRSLAEFWVAVLDDWCIAHVDADGDVLIFPGPSRDSAPGAVPIMFLGVDELDAEPTRWHFDLVPGDQQAEVARLEGLGAQVVDIGQGDVSWVVMIDPEGNRFCVLRSFDG